MIDVNGNGRRKYAVYLKPETMAKVEANLKGDNCKNRSEFIEKAIDLYCSVITKDSMENYLPTAIVDTIKAMVESFENRLSSLLFKNAVVHSILYHIIAATGNVTSQQVEAVRAMCVKDVMRLYGNISLEDAIRFQKV